MAWLQGRQLPPTTLFCLVGGKDWRTAVDWPQLAAFVPTNADTNAGQSQFEQRIYDNLSQVPGLIQKLLTRLRPGRSASQGQALDEGHRIRTLAIWHRRFTVGIVGLVVAFAPLVAASDSLPLAICLLLYIAVVIVRSVLVFGLAQALGSKSAWIWGIAGIPPFIGGIVLLFLSRKASKELHKAGVEVGLLGPKSIPSV